MNTANNTYPEILAPAGSVEQLIAAVNNGCDSVYLGLDCFNARMKAPNFTLENLPQWISYCHLHNVKVYVAINTSLKNDEFAAAVRALVDVYNMYADGVILTDIALICIAARLPQPFDIVASTQLNVHDKWGAKFLKKCGATTVVCARESSLDDIKQIVNSGINAECFIHGATCVCQSGQCLFSAMVGGNSGNRGLCAQPCRKLYSVNGKGEKYYMLSARDLCGLTTAKQLADSGVHTFKIEGRNRRPEYAGITSRIYKRLVTHNCVPQSDDYTDLAKMYNRAMSPLSYLYGGNSDIIYKQTCNHIGINVGKIANGQICSRVRLYKGDGVKVFDKNREVCGGTILNDGLNGVHAEFTAPVTDGMSVNITTDNRLCEDVLATESLLQADAEFIAYPNQNAVLRLYCNGTEITYVSDFIVPAAQNCPTNRQEVIEQLQKTGNSYYTMRNIVVEMGEIFLAKSQINAMRRYAMQMLTDAIAGDYNIKFIDRANAPTADELIASINGNISLPISSRAVQSQPVLAIVCYTKEQLCAARQSADILIYKPSEINDETLSAATQYKCFVDLPSFSDNDYVYKLFKQLQIGAVCHNLGQVQVMRELALPYIAGSGLNIFNDQMARQFDDAAAFVYSLELTLDEIGKFADQSGIIFVDGNITLMKTVHCPYKVAYGCNCNNCMAHKELVYTDELGNRFRFVRRRDARCSFELLNGNKLSVVYKLNRVGRYMLDFDPQIADHYLNLNKGFADGYAENQPYTKGRLYAKVK